MADVLAVRDEYRLQQWAMIVQECSNSGLSNREFCRQRGIPEKSFYYWQKKLREQLADKASPQLVPLEAASVEKDILHIRFRNAELTLPSGIDIDAVASVLHSLQSL